MAENYGEVRQAKLTTEFVNGHIEEVLITQRADEQFVDWWWYDDRTQESGWYNIASTNPTRHWAGALWYPSDSNRLWLNPIDEETWPDLYEDDWVTFIDEDFPTIPTPAYGQVELWVTDDNEFDLKETGDIQCYMGNFNLEPDEEQTVSDFLEFWPEATDNTNTMYNDQYLQRLVFKLAKRTKLLGQHGLEGLPREIYYA